MSHGGDVGRVAATAAAGIGLPGFLGTNTGALTACAGRAAPGVGDSGLRVHIERRGGDLTEYNNLRGWGVVTL